MPGKIQRRAKIHIEEEIEVDASTEDAISMALGMCPPGQWIEIHAAYCDISDCTCMPRRIQKPEAASS